MYVTVTSKQCSGTDILFCIQGLNCFIADICDVGLSWGDHNRGSLMQIAFMFTVAFFFFERCYQSALFETSHYLLKNSKSCFIIVVVLAHCVHPSGLLFSFSYRIWCPRLCASEHVSKGETFHYIHMPNKPYKMHSPCLKLCAHLWLHINLILYWYTSLHTVGPKSVRPLF